MTADRAAMLAEWRKLSTALAATDAARGPFVPDDAPLGPSYGLFGMPAQGTDRTRAVTDITVTIRNVVTHTKE